MIASFPAMALFAEQLRFNGNAELSFDQIESDAPLSV